MKKIPPAVWTEIDAGKAIPTNPAKSCGTCTACCYVVPVSEIGLNQYQRCKHLMGPPDLHIGCRIYANRPKSCKNWSCGWLMSDLPEDYRPDRCGFILDPVPDVIRAGGPGGKEMVAAQIWVLPGHEFAWQSARAMRLLRSIIDGQGIAVLWRMAGHMARAFGKSSDGKYWKTEPTPDADELSGYESTGARLAGAQRLIDR